MKTKWKDEILIILDDLSIEDNLCLVAPNQICQFVSEIVHKKLNTLRLKKSVMTPKLIKET